MRRSASSGSRSRRSGGGPLFCPVGRGLDLIGGRWTLVLVRHLLGGPRGFQELRTRTGIGPRVLARRLKELAERELVESVQVGTRSLYALTERGRSLAPIVSEIARWWVLNAMEEAGPYSETTPVSVVEALPFLLRDDRAKGVRIAYELRLTGPGGGVWSIYLEDGSCRIEEGFAEHADVRYTADARDWCRVALGVMDDREAVDQGLLVKDGKAGSLAWYFHQVAHPPAPEKEKTR